MTTELGPWFPADSQGTDVLIDTTRDKGWVHASFWSPAQALKPGYDEVSVLFQPGLKVTVKGVAGNGWVYDRSWTQQEIERCIEGHIQQSRDIRQKKIAYISVTELCQVVKCE